MFKYEYTINWNGQAFKDVFECEGNEDAKREVMRRLKVTGIPAGKYVFVDIMRLDDSKSIIEDQRKNLPVDGNISAMNTDAPMTTVMYVAAWSRPIRIPSTVSQTTRVATSSMPPVHDQMNVSIIGTPHCGRAVFLGLLYETLIRIDRGQGLRGPAPGTAFGKVAFI